MTLEWKNDIVEQLIKEDSGSTIKDFQIVLDEVERVEQATDGWFTKTYREAVIHAEIGLTKRYRLSQRVTF
jgi:hypothetical protein